MADDSTDTFLPKPVEQPEPWLEKLKLKIPGYQLLHEIGRGGQAVVYKAIHEATGRLVAIKILHGGAFAEGIARERLHREMAVLAALEDKGVNIVQVTDFGSTLDGNEFLVMKYIAGQRLDKFLLSHDEASERSVDAASRLKLFIKIASCVAAAHRAGVVHRDLSPSNILVDERGEPHILDFGLARTAFDRFISGNPAQLSVTGAFLGKVAYASPEQALGKSECVDIRSDVYALGVILYQILTHGEFPYEVVGSIADVLTNIVNTPPTPPSKRLAARAEAARRQRPRMRNGHPSTIHPGIEAIVLKALEKDPANRYQTAGELERDVENYLGGKPTVAQLGQLAPILPKSLNTAWIAVAAVVLVLMLAWTVQVWIPGLFTSNPEEPKRHAVASSDPLPDSGQGAAQPLPSVTTGEAARAFDLNRVQDLVAIAEVTTDAAKQRDLVAQAIRTIGPSIFNLDRSDLEAWKVVARLAVLSDDASLAKSSVDVLQHHLSDPQAEALVGRMKPAEQQRTNSVQLFERAKHGDPAAMRQLGKGYESGGDVGPRSDVRAREWYEKGAAAGDPFSMTQLGIMHAEGRGGLPRNDQNAVQWYRKAAAGNNAKAMRLLGYAYLFGKGRTTKDEGQAMHWFQTAAEAGDPVGMWWLGKMLESGAGKSRPDAAQALEWFQKSAKLGNLEAQDLLKARGP